MTGNRDETISIMLGHGEACVICGLPARGLVTMGAGRSPLAWCPEHQRLVIDGVRADLDGAIAMAEGKRDGIQAWIDDLVRLREKVNQEPGMTLRGDG